MTNQELFDKVATHLRRQGAKAVNNGQCMYRAPDGKQCAAGCLILDEHYSPDLEGDSVTMDEVRITLLESGVAEDQINLVLDLQHVHDDFRVDQWESELASVAQKHHLTLPAAP